MAWTISSLRLCAFALSSLGLMKGLIGALLAVKSDEDPRLGPGARENVFDLARPELTKLREFLSGFA
jgi:hypothetical protein